MRLSSIDYVPQVSNVLTSKRIMKFAKEAKATTSLRTFQKMALRRYQ